jgi:hypothetical protein
MSVALRSTRCVARAVLSGVRLVAVSILGRKRITAGTIELGEVAIAGRHVWAGYYDLPVFSPDETELIYHCWRPGDDWISYGVFDLASKEFHEIGRTRAWSFQLGVRLQFIDQDKVIFYSEEQGALQTSIYSLAESRIVRNFSGISYYSIAHNKNLISALNYKHISQHRPGYGFGFAPEDLYSALAIYEIEAATVTPFLRVDKKEMTQRAREFAGEGALSESDVHLNHPLFNPSDDGVAFVICSFGAKRRQRLFVVSLRDRQWRACPLITASHFCWISDQEISVFGVAEDGRTGYWRWSIRDGSVEAKAPIWPSVDGHQTWDRKRPGVWVTDTYPNRLRYQSLFRIDTSGAERQMLGQFYAPFGMAYDKCDLHPRLTQSGEKVIIDSAYSGLRRILLLTQH